MDQEKVGKFLSELRKDAGLTQEQMAQKLGVTNKTVSRWETGVYIPDVSLLLEISQMFNVSVNEILSGERLADTAYREKANDNIAYLLDSRKKAVKKVIAIAAATIVAIMLLCIAAFIVRFIVSRSHNLYANISDARYEKTISAEIDLSAYSALDGETALFGDDVCVRFVLPQGYTEASGGAFVSAERG